MKGETNNVGIADKPRFETASGIPVKALYSRNDLKNWNEEKRLGKPGRPPFTRGPYESMYRARLWTPRLSSGMGDPVQSNRHFKYLLSQEQTSLCVYFDLPTQLGYDSDDERAGNDVGAVGVPISSLEDIELLFYGVHIDKIDTYFTVNATAPIIFAMYLALAEKRGIDISKLRGTLQSDILSEIISRGESVLPLQPSLKLVCDVIEYSVKNTPEFNPISVTGSYSNGTGGNSIQEVAFCLSNAIAYSESLVKRGIDFDMFAPHLIFQFACGEEIFEEVAKFRAARRIWSKIAAERFGSRKEDSARLRFFSCGSTAEMAPKEQINNVVRSTFQCFAGVLGGADGIRVLPYDEATSIPTEESERLGLRTQQIIAQETGVTKTVDPAGGSYFIEWLTDQLENAILEKMNEIDRIWGGMSNAVVNGYPQREVIARAERQEEDLISGKRVVIGINTHVGAGKEKTKMARPNKKAALLQKRRVKALKKKRNSVRVERALQNLKAALKDDRINVMPDLIEAVKSYATVGEITSALKQIYGNYGDASLGHSS